MKSESRSSVSRSRWAAIGAAVAVSLGAGGLAVTHALTSPTDKSAFVPIAPCRLFDLRPVPDQVGPRGTALNPGETYTQPVWGANGNCNIPTDATGVAMNVTAVGGTVASFLTIWPSDVSPRPLASNLNWVPGAAPTPNKVDVKLSADGKINLFNLTGTVYVLADVVGYYAPASQPPFTEVIAQTTGNPALPAVLGQIASVNLTLPDVCAGADSWQVLVQADGYYLTGGSTGGANSGATVALGLTGTTFTDGTVQNQNFNQTVQWREAYSTAFVFTVDSGTHTFFELGSTNHPAGVTAAQNNLIAKSVAVTC